MTDDTPVCPVCVEEVHDDSHTLEGCRHVFHSVCIVRWMRRGNLTCPTCRHDLHQSEGPRPSLALPFWARGNYLRTVVARRSSAPRDLTRLVHRIRTAEAKLTHHSRSMRDLKKCRESRLEDYLKHQAGLSRTQRRLWDLKRMLNCFHSYETPMPPLSVLG